MACLFFDIDGTLIDYPRGLGSIPENTQRELSRVRGLGHKTFVCTGRPFTMIEPHLYAGFDGIVCAGGAHVILGGKNILVVPMDYADILRAVDLLDSFASDYIIECTDGSYLRPDAQVLRSYFARFGREGSLIADFERDEVLKSCLKIEANVTAQQKDILVEEVGDLFKWIANPNVHDAEYSFELYDPSVSKQGGLKAIIDALGCPREETYAFGDASIDREMVEWAATGVAMGSGEEGLKAVADIVCDGVHEDGIPKILAQLF